MTKRERERERDYIRISMCILCILTYVSILHFHLTGDRRMAPKGGKKGGKKKGGKKKDKGEEEDEGEQKEAISELDKHFYLNQIQVS